MQKLTFLILGFMCILTPLRAQETPAESNTEEPVIVQEPTVDRNDSKDSEESNEVEQETIPAGMNWTCGLRNIQGLGEIKDDPALDPENTRFGEFPWMVTLSEVIEIDVYNFVCSGALLSSKAVATTAHCVHRFKNNPESLVVTAGLWNSSQENQVYLPQTRLAKSITTLEHFDEDFHMNDIVVVIVQTPFDLKEHIQPICLSPITESFEGRNCLLNYWDIESGNVSLRKAELSVVSSKRCEEKLKLHKATQDLPIHDSLICAVSERNKGDCDKQLGAPLICSIQGVVDRYYLAGVSSIGHECNSDNYTGLFVNVALLSRWIASVTAD